MTPNASERGVASACPSSDELTLDQLLAEPIVQQLMRRDRIDAAAIRHLLQEVASARPVSPAADRSTVLPRAGCEAMSDFAPGAIGPV